MQEGLNYAVKKNVFIEGNQYLMSINIVKVQGEFNINIQGEVQGEVAVDKDKPLIKLKGAVIPVDELKNIIRMMELQDVLFYTWPYKTIASFQDFCGRILYPFVAVSEDLKVEIRPKSPGLIGSSWEIKFMGETCMMYLHHLTKTDFKLVITSSLS